MIKQNEEQRAFAQAHLQSFKEKYFFQAQLNLLQFDEDLGDFIIRDDVSDEFQADALDAYHQVNTGWAMYSKGIGTGLKLNQWISVDERLPTLDDCKHSDNSFLAWDGECIRRMPLCLFKSTVDITHWQPLPFPPQAQEQSHG